jgi:squalene-hopene/tetraprenyl-beta-curcumene cyclase
MGSFQWLEPSAARRHRKAIAATRAETRALAEAIQPAIHNAAEALLQLQEPSGHWCAELTADSSLESDYILLQLWLYPPEGASWNPPTRGRVDRACRSILARQLPDGGFNLYPQGPSDINCTIKAYGSLKLAGTDPQSEPMRRMRDCILRLGGIQAANSYVKINLSLFGLFPRRYVPSVPPEMVLLPGDVLYEMSSWTRAILVPLSVVQSKGVYRPAPEGLTLEELFLPGKKLAHPKKDGLSVLFHHMDKFFKIWERRGLKDVRAAAIREAEHWMLDRTRFTEGLGAIYPAMMYHVMALEALGYGRDQPDLMDAIRNFDALLVEKEDGFYFQPCFSPVWDTAIATFALGEMGQAPPERMTQTADWLIAREVRRKGDWSVKRPDLEPSGWAFEFANEYYPDIDDTAMVLLALLHARGSDPERQARCERRAVNWLINMQSGDGGWAAFDVDNDWKILNRIPFADHNAMLDPTCPDITGRVLECLCRRGFAQAPFVMRGMKYLLKTQETDGSWYGRWGVDYIYGTFLAMRGLQAVGVPDVHPAIEQAARWLRLVQNQDGGWGESCASYKENKFVRASSTASQTAWALIGLASAGEVNSPAVRKGVRYLLDTQKPDGTWNEDLATGTGFPNVFFMTYHLYRNYFPLMALSACGRALES